MSSSLSSEPDPYSMQHYHTKFQVMLGRQPHNARQVIKHAKTIGHFQDMYRVPLKKNKIEEIRKKTGYVEHGGQLVKKSYATKVRKEAARELRLRRGNRPVVGGKTPTQQLMDLVSSAKAGDALVDPVRRLLAAGADVNARSKEEGAPLIFVALGNELWDVVVVLLDHHRIDAFVTFEEENLLMMATYFCAPSFVLLKLLEKGVDVNARNPDGTTALGNAFRSKCMDSLKLLLAHGANPYTIGGLEEYERPVQFARGAGTFSYAPFVAAIRAAQATYVQPPRRVQASRRRQHRWYS